MKADLTVPYSARPHKNGVHKTPSPDLVLPPLEGTVLPKEATEYQKKYLLKVIYLAYQLGEEAGFRAAWDSKTDKNTELSTDQAVALWNNATS